MPHSGWELGGAAVVCWKCDKSTLDPIWESCLSPPRAIVGGNGHLKLYCAVALG